MQNQCKREITFDTQLKTALISKNTTIYNMTLYSCQMKILASNRFSLIALLKASAMAIRPRWSEYKIRACDPTTFKQEKKTVLLFIQLFR